MSTSANKKINRQQAVDMQWKLIRQWDSRFDVWPFTYGLGTLAAACAGSGAKLNQSFRKNFNLRTEFRRATYLPNVIIPTVCAGMFHAYLVSSDILIEDTKCFTCLETRAISLQLLFGLAYPLVLSPLTSMMGARHFYTYDAPSPWQIKKIFHIWWSMVKLHQTKINIIAVAQIAVAALITHQEWLAIRKLNSKLDIMLISDKPN